MPLIQVAATELGINPAYLSSGLAEPEFEPDAGPVGSNLASLVPCTEMTGI